MKIHEYQAKELLAAAGASVPRGLVASTPAEAVQAFDQIGVPVVLKRRSTPAAAARDASRTAARTSAASSMSAGAKRSRPSPRLCSPIPW